MEQLIRNVTTSITEQLSGDKSFYTPGDLREYDIPEFLIQRVEIEIYRNLNESIVPPHSEWADMSANDVEDAWEQFIDAIVAEVRMPASFASTVFETAIADVMEMILKPRKAIPDILFGPKKKLTLSDVEKQLSAITVNSHLSQAVYKYMTRKGLSEIEIGTARRVVMKVDERITANYNSLNWAQLLQPLFILAGPKIDTELFRVFFRDRNMDRISRRFDLLSGSLNKIEFIETLSSPDLLNEEGYEDDQVSLFDVQQSEESEPGNQTGSSSDKIDKQIKSDPENDSRSLNNLASESPEETFTAPDQEKVFGRSKSNDLDPEESVFFDEGEDDYEDEIEPDQEKAEDSLAGSFQGRREGKDDSGSGSDDINDTIHSEPAREPGPEESDDDLPLYSRFDSDSNDDDAHPEEDDADNRFADQFLYGEDNKTDEDTDWISEAADVRDEPEKESETPPVVSEADKSKEFGLDEGAEDDDPIWHSFLGDEDLIEEEDIPEYSGFANLDETDTEKEDDEEAPLIDLTVKESEGDSAEHLIGWLKDDEERFISHIFSGSGKAYEEALIDLNQLDDWKQASRFIEKEIFARNLVDMYDEEAVDFTDRLQTYFDEFKS